MSRLLETYIREVLDGYGNKTNGKAPGNLRNGVPLTGHTGGNVLTDEENEEQQAKQDAKLAATVLIIADDGSGTETAQV